MSNLLPLSDSSDEDPCLTSFPFRMAGCTDEPIRTTYRTAVVRNLVEAGHLSVDDDAEKSLEKSNQGSENTFLGFAEGETQDFLRR